MSAACPVCDHDLGTRSASCFRCEADLSRWWPLEDALTSALPTPVAEAAPRPRRAPWLVLAAVAVAGAALGRASVPGPPSAPVAVALAPAGPAAVVPAPTAPAAVAPPSVGDPLPVRLTWHVQRGDSPWRIAAALTGDGRRWPEITGASPPLRAGSTLRLDVPVPAAAGPGGASE